ncbi:conserved hypothetical protein [Mycolicibacter sinensis]|uniref:Uncharacterized protein n=2 Tax=Mycolicibacter sinensis (strain JDM601) TaxID=875328 RepID=F5YRL1_MYCSD|nr:conserved hypothetical protein [Mycolicibacter sinensis]
MVSTFEFAARDAYLDREYFGLAPMGTYFFSCVSDEDGNFYAPIRKVVTEMSTGLQLSSNLDADNLEIAPEAFLASHRGAGVKWSLADDARQFTVGASATPYSQPLELILGDNEFAWGEGELMQVQGRRLGLGYQWFTPNIDERGGNFYASQAFAASGHIQGRPVSGYMSIDSFYGPTGQVYNNGPIFNAVEMAWVSFVNTYADGQHESGGLCLGKEEWGFAVVSDHDGPIIETTEIQADVMLDADRYVSTARYTAGGTQWEFTAIDRGQMRALAAARGDAYHGQAGSVRRVGDTRIPLTSHAWIETFPLNGLNRHYGT